MTRVLVDTSSWIDFFRGKPTAQPLLDLIDHGQVVTNELILAELLPSIHQRNENELRDLLLSLEKVELKIEWEGIIELQIANLKTGNGHVGLPDLIIVQNCLQNDLVLYENDKHFSLIPRELGLRLMREPR